MRYPRYLPMTRSVDGAAAEQDNETLNDWKYEKVIHLPECEEKNLWGTFLCRLLVLALAKHAMFSYIFHIFAQIKRKLSTSIADM